MEQLGTNEPATTEGLLGVENKTIKDLDKRGNERDIHIPTGFITLKDVKTKGRFDITDEQSDGQRRLNTIAYQLQLLQPGDIQRQGLIDEMMEVQGLSAASFGMENSTGQATPQQQPTQTQNTLNQVLPQGQQ